jgi:hypothetical protein
MTMMKINEIWSELESDNSFYSGLLLRRFSGSALADIYIALKGAEKLRCIATVVSKEILIDIDVFDNLKDISVEVLIEERFKDKNILIFTLHNNEHSDIFSVLAEDLLSSVEVETNEKKLVKTLLNRYEKWKSLFDKLALNGLSSEEQRGLFGELFFLRKFLIQNDFGKVVGTWMGPSGEIKDFQYNNWALEVKTSIGNHHQKVHISNERQLDPTHLETLFLYHISLEKVQQDGETLNQIIQSILEIINGDTNAINKFRAKLYETGYYDNHAWKYDAIGYHIRQDSFYKVEGDFPRVQENEVRNGVGDVKYTIILSQCHQYQIVEDQVLKKLQFNE